MKLESVRHEIRLAIEAAQEKQAGGLVLLKLPGEAAFAEYFLLCSGSSERQTYTISDAIEERLGREGMRLQHREGRHGAEWVLLDYGQFVVHIFSERAREYYDLERLWRTAERIEIPELDPRRSRGSNAEADHSPRSRAPEHDLEHDSNADRDQP